LQARHNAIAFMFKFGINLKSRKENKRHSREHSHSRARLNRL